MKTEMKAPGTWLHRFAIRLFTIFLTLLIFWTLGFLIDDSGALLTSDYAAVEQRHLDQELVVKHRLLEQQSAALVRQIDHHRAQQQLVGDSARNLQQTINQLIALQRLGIEKSIAFSAVEQENFARSLNLFLDHQQRYQELNQSIALLDAQRQHLVQEQQDIEQRLEQQRQSAKEEYLALNTRHRLHFALLQLAVLIPLLISAAVILIKQRASIYFPLFLAFGAATGIKVTLVIHDYFPSQYFKYILIGTLLLVVARLLIYFIRARAFPQTQGLIKQYREGYERFLCPICGYPMRMGPRRFLFWTRQTVNKIIVPGTSQDQEELYTCPSCGASLFEECPACHQIRPALLPYCAHCGAEKTLQFA